MFRIVTGKSRRRRRAARRQSVVRRVVRYCIVTSVLLVCSVLALSRLFSHMGWGVDLLANVSYLAAIPLLLMGFVLLLRRHVVTGLFACVMAMVAYYPMFPICYASLRNTGSSRSAEEVRASGELSVLIANVHEQPAALDRLVELFSEYEPDVVVIVEAGRSLGPAFVTRAEVVDRYPMRAVPPIDILYSMVMLSRHPWQHVSFPEETNRHHYLYAFREAYIVNSPAGRFVLTASHPPSPRDATSWAAGNVKIKHLCEVAPNELMGTNLPVVVAGDFNTTATGYRYQWLQAESGLHSSDSDCGGFVGTWPSDWPGFLRLALDRAWGSPDVIFTSRQVLPDIGSDHLPILLTFRLVSADNEE